MSIPEQIFLIIALLFFLLAGIKLFSAPLRLAVKVALNTALGFLALVALDLFSPILGIHVAVTGLNALIVGVLGLPGPGLQTLMQWVFLS